jgi:hypothetical protein
MSTAIPPQRRKQRREDHGEPNVVLPACVLCGRDFAERDPAAVSYRAELEARTLWSSEAFIASGRAHARFPQAPPGTSCLDVCGACLMLVVLWADEHRPGLLSGEVPVPVPRSHWAESGGWLDGILDA